MKSFSVALYLFVFSVAANADTELVLQPGQCAQVDGKNYCWWYRPSTYLHPELAPRPCDFRKDCPITLLIPTTVNSPNIVSSAMEQKLDQGKGVANTNVLFFCRKQKAAYSLVRVEVKGEEKHELVVNEYGDDEGKCRADEARYSGSGIQSVTVTDPTRDIPLSTNGPVVVETTPARQEPCPYTKQYKTQVRKIPLKRIIKDGF